MKIIKCLAVLGCLSITSCATLQQQISDNIKQPQVSYKTMSIGQLTSSSIELFPVFSVYNSNMFDIPVTKISYNVTVNQQKVTSGIAKNIGTLPANQDKDIQLAMRFEQQALNTLKNMLLNVGKVDLVIDGKINVLGLPIPFEKRATIYMPSVKLGKIKVKKASFNQVQLNLELIVDNKNDFSFPLNNVKYNVSSRNASLFNGQISSQKMTTGQQTLNVPLSINPSQLYSNILGLLRSPIIPLTFKIDGPLFSSEHTLSVNLNDLLK